MHPVAQVASLNSRRADFAFVDMPHSNGFFDVSYTWRAEFTLVLYGRIAVDLYDHAPVASPAKLVWDCGLIRFEAIGRKLESTGNGTRQLFGELLSVSRVAFADMERHEQLGCPINRGERVDVANFIAHAETIGGLLLHLAKCPQFVGFDFIAFDIFQCGIEKSLASLANDADELAYRVSVQSSQSLGCSDRRIFQKQPKCKFGLLNVNSDAAKQFSFGDESFSAVEATEALAASGIFAVFFPVLVAAVAKTDHRNHLALMQRRLRRKIRLLRGIQSLTPSGFFSQWRLPPPLAFSPFKTALIIAGSRDTLGHDIFGKVAPWNPCFYAFFIRFLANRTEVAGVPGAFCIAATGRASTNARSLRLGQTMVYCIPPRRVFFYLPTKKARAQTDRVCIAVAL